MASGAFYHSLVHFAKDTHSMLLALLRAEAGNIVQEAW